MRKLVASIAVGVLLSVGSVSVLAACADLITVGDQVCVLTGSAKAPSGAEMCFYKCGKMSGPAPTSPPNPE
jgi:hypothetical protein